MKKPYSPGNDDGNRDTGMPCPTCSECPTCGGDKNGHLVSRRVAASINVRQTSDPDADVRRAYVVLKMLTISPARTHEEWAEQWGAESEATRMAYRKAFTAVLRR